MPNRHLCRQLPQIQPSADSIFLAALLFATPFLLPLPPNEFMPPQPVLPPKGSRLCAESSGYLHFGAHSFEQAAAKLRSQLGVCRDGVVVHRRRDQLVIQELQHSHAKTLQLALYFSIVIAHPRRLIVARHGVPENPPIIVCGLADGI